MPQADAARAIVADREQRLKSHDVSRQSHCQQCDAYFGNESDLHPRRISGIHPATSGHAPPRTTSNLLSISKPALCLTTSSQTLNHRRQECVVIRTTLVPAAAYPSIPKT